MRIPTKIPGLKAMTIVVGVYAAVWIALEGDLRRVLLLSLGLTLVAFGHLVQRFLGGRELSYRRWLLAAANLGALIGLSCGAFGLVFMALKTGLHSHGPEFTQDEIRWLLQQTPLWGLAGSLAGLGLGLLTWENPDQRPKSL